MPDKIVIDFDDEKDPPNDPDNEKIVIEIESGKGEEKTAEEESDPVRKELEILTEEVSSFYKAGEGLTKFYPGEMEFPSGTGSGFRRRILLELKDKFLNGIIESSKYIIVSSATGFVYLIGRESGRVKEKLSLNEAFEKTGAVIRNMMYVNSLRSVFLLEDQSSEIKNNKIFSAPAGCFIWSSLLYHNEKIFFLTFDNKDSADLNILGCGSKQTESYKIRVEKYISDQFCIADGKAIINYDGKICLFDIGSKEFSFINVACEISEDSQFMYISGRVYFTTKSSELFYFEPDNAADGAKFTGIKENYINSVAGYAEYLFLGTLNGWKCFGINGMPVYDFEDDDENKIEAVSKNLLIVSKKGKIVIHNINRFQEAERIVVVPDKKDERVISVMISKHEIFILSSNGKFVSYTNDKLNIHV